MAIFSGTAYWAKLETPQNNFDPTKLQWSIDIGNLDDENKKIAQDFRMILKNKGDDRGDFVTIKRPSKRYNGQPNQKPNLVDAKMQDMSGTLIGNGSKVNASFTTFDYKNGPAAGKKGFDLQGIQVVELVKFDRPEGSDTSGDFQPISGGYDAVGDAPPFE